MKKMMTTGLAMLLLAGAATEALSQERGERQGGRFQGARERPGDDDGRRDRGERGERGDRGDRAQRTPRAERTLGADAVAQPPAAAIAQPQATERRDRGREGMTPFGRHPDSRVFNQQERRPDADRRGNDRRMERRDDDRRWEGRRDDRRDDRRWDNDGHRDWRPQARHWDRPHRPIYQSPRRFRGHVWRAPPGFYVRSWAFGDVLPRAWYVDDYRIMDWWNYSLAPPPPGYEWIRVGSDALLVDQWSGRVVEVVRLIFW